MAEKVLNNEDGLMLAIPYLFGEFGERESQVYGSGLAVIHGETPRTATPLTAGLW